MEATRRRVHERIRLDTEFHGSKGELPEVTDGQDPELPGLGRIARILSAQRQTATHKLYSALGGGLSLIVPMLIMVLVPGRVASLVTTSVFVFAFAIGMALKSHS